MKTFDFDLFVIGGGSGGVRAARMAAVLLATALAFTIGCSRVFLQVHFASDVLAGFASGTAWLAVCIGAQELIRYRLTFKRPG